MTTRTTLFTLALLTAASAQAAGLPDPGDYAPAPAGSTVLAVYAQHQTADRVYDHGQRVAGDLGLKLDLGIVRAMRFFELGGMPADLELIVPTARQRVHSAGYSESGIGNLIVGSTLWTLSDAQAGRHLGWAAYLSLPTGGKRAQGLAVSEDRYALDLETGYITRLGGAWSLDLVGQLEFYSRDRTTRIERRPMARGFAHLSYRLSDANTLAVSLRQTYGTRESQYGVTVLGARRDTNLMLTWQHQLTETVQLQLQYQQDVKVRNGPALQGVQARAVVAF